MRDNSEAEQILLEKESSELAVRRFDRRQEQAFARGDGENSAIGQALLASTIGLYKQRIEDVAFNASTGRPGRKSAITKLLTGIPLNTEEVAFIALRSVIQCILARPAGGSTKNRPLSDAHVSRWIGTRIHDELFLRSVREEHPKLIKRWMEEAKERSLTREEAKKMMRRQVRNLEMEWEYTDAHGVVWDSTVQLKFGRFLLELFVQATNLVYLKTIQVRTNQRIKTVIPTEEMCSFIDKARSSLLGRTAMYLPMVVKPRPWDCEEGLYGGGYITREVPPYPLIKKSNREWLDQVINNSPEPMIAALNAVQETPWRVNTVVLDALDYVYGSDRGIAGLPRSSKRELPPAPEDYNKDYRRECYQIHEENRRNLVKRMNLETTIWMGKKFSEYERFYFPHDLDTRGRAYPKPVFLNPQGTDYVKGILEFADGKALETEDAAAWLAIHVANSWGEDKISLEERIRWTEAHEELIRSVAADPKSDLRWTEADNPFVFLQAALAWSGYLEKGLDYVCHTPIHVDATCSGLQHYSGLLLDAVGGKAVNLLDLEERQDVYADVAKKAVELVKEDLGGDKTALAEAWLEFGIDRKITKRSVMVVPYAATYISCAEYTRQAVNEKTASGVPMPWCGDETEFIHYGAKKIWKAIELTVIAASAAMEWISKAAKAYAKAGNEYLTWGTPSGMVVRHRKADLEPWRMNTVLDGSRIQLKAYDEKIGLNPQKMASSTPPSFIHSLDAAHMCLAIDAALAAGISDFAVVHDSFATHAVHMPIFSQCIRDTFHEMYTSQDILDGLRQQIQDGVPDQLEPLPPKGDLDIDQVRVSTFFFS